VLRIGKLDRWIRVPHPLEQILALLPEVLEVGAGG
jgi:hypothetical protein